MPLIEQIAEIVKTGAYNPQFRRARIPRPTPPDPGEAPGLLCWGSAGDIASPELVGGVDFATRDGDEEHVEMNRQAEKVRVENPEDAEDWVEVDRAQKLFFNKTTHQIEKRDNTTGGNTDFGDFSATPIELSQFKPLGSSSKKTKLVVTMKNTATSA